MDILEKIRQHEKELTPREREVCDIVLNDPLGVYASTTSQIVARYNVSQSSISRFCQKIGYNSFSDFRMDLYLYISTNHFSEDSDTDNRDLTYYMGEMARAIRNALADSQLERIAGRINSSDIIYTCGTAYSSFPARLLAFQLLLSSYKSIFIQTGTEQESLRATSDRDTLIMFSAINPTYQDLMRAMRDLPADKQPHTILVASSPRHPLRKAADEVIVLPTWTSLHYPVSVDYSFSTTVFCNLLVSHLSNTRV